MYHQHVNRPLTKEDIKAIRAADDSVVFSLRVQSPADDRDVADCEIKLTKRTEPKDGWTTREVLPRIEYEIPVDWSLTDYAAEHSYESDLKYGFAMVHSPTVNEHWQTFVRLIKAGDAICLRWIGSNTSEDLRAAGVFHDSLDIAIMRRSGDSWKLYVQFQIADTFTRHYDVRMLRASLPTFR